MEPIRPHPLLSEHYVTLDARSRYVRTLFDSTACHYSRINQVFALGSGGWYRRRALRSGGLHPGMRLLDIAVGTGLVARAALDATANRLDVVGLDISQSMLAEARRTLTVPLIQGSAEQLPVADASFDFVSMGYALRHVSDLVCTFNEFLRVLRPGGTLLLLEIAPPAGRAWHSAAAWYLGRAVPLFCRLLRPRTRSSALMRYFWDTIEHCVPPQVILDQLRSSGFVEVRCEKHLDLFHAYRARRPITVR
jgi:demethylmenaquinone methyltransferase / 2-methoxy-6-polyprenyl-1,4-benzoquinol methylase